MLALNAICCPCIVYSTNRDKLQHLAAHGEREPSHPIPSHPIQAISSPN